MGEKEAHIDSRTQEQLAQLRGAKRTYERLSDYSAPCQASKAGLFEILEEVCLTDRRPSVSFYPETQTVDIGFSLRETVGRGALDKSYVSAELTISHRSGVSLKIATSNTFYKMGAGKVVLSDFRRMYEEVLSSSKECSNRELLKQVINDALLVAGYHATTSSPQESAGRVSQNQANKPENDSRQIGRSIEPERVGAKISASNEAHEAMRKLFSVEKPDVSFDQIAGQSIAVEEARILVEEVKDPEKFRNWGVEPPRGILLHGEPGNGKTLIAKAIASQADAIFLSASTADLMSKWQGESATFVRNLFNFAREEARISGKHCIIFLDEVDALVPSRDSSGFRAEASRLVLATFLEQLDGLRELGPITAIAATNKKDMVDDAFLSRMNKQIYVPRPSELAVADIFKLHLDSRSKMAGRPLFFPNIDLARIARETIGLSGRDIADAVSKALELKAREAVRGEAPTLITEEDLLAAIAQSGKLRVEENE